MNFYQHLELILDSKAPHAKIEMFQTFYSSYKKGEIIFEESFISKEFDANSSKEVLPLFIFDVHILKKTSKR